MLVHMGVPTPQNPQTPLTPPSEVSEGARQTFPDWGRGTTKWWMRRTTSPQIKGYPYGADAFDDPSVSGKTFTKMK